MKRLLLVALLLAGCATAPPNEPVHIVLVGTTDVHGWFNGRVEIPKGGGEGVHHGGVPLLASYIDALRHTHGNRVVVLDSGDMFQGTLESNLFEGEPVVRAYNAIGYAAAAVGNHEFDYGPVGPKVIASLPGEDPLGALKRVADIANFPLLSANMTERDSGQTPGWAKRYTMVSADGVKIGIIGLSTPDTPNVTLEANVRTLDFRDPVEATVAAAQELRARGADAIVVIAHMGGRCTEVHSPYDSSSCDDRHEANRFLEALPPDTIDVYLGGHTHSRMRHFLHGVAVAQSAPFSNEFSTVDIWVDRRAKRVIDERTAIRPPTMICALVYSGTERCDPNAAPAGARLEPRTFAGLPIGRKPQIQAVIEPFLTRTAAKRHERLGLTTTAQFTRSFSSESELGNLLADAMRVWAGADIAFMNSGGIRSNLRAGDLIYSDIFEVSPFDNYPAMVTMTGQQIIDALRDTVKSNRGLLQVSGLRYTIDRRRDDELPAEQRNELAGVTLEDGQPLDLQKLYRVIMPDFLAYGGDAMAAVMKTIPPERIEINQERPLRDVVIDALRRRRAPLTPSVEGRITVLNVSESRRTTP